MNLSVKDLEVADILLSTSNHFVSWAIRTGTLSRYSHAALYIGNGTIIESIGEGVKQNTLNDAMSQNSLVSVYRRLNMPAGQANMVVQYAMQQQRLGKKYDLSGAFGGGVTSTSGMFISIFLSPIVAIGGMAADDINRNNPEGKFYCSELVAMAFEYAKVPLTTGVFSSSSSMTPQDISHSHYLNYIGDLKVTK